MKKYWLLFFSVILFGVTSYAQVTISSPASGATVSSPVKFVASAASDTGRPITAMRIYVDSVSLYTVSASSLSTTISLGNGNHNVNIVAWDASGKSYNKAETITVGAAATTTSGITVTSPSSGSTVGSPVTFSATASSGNSSTPITAMRLYVDSASVYTVNSASLTTSQPLATGTHNITFVAWDSTGKSYSQPETITVGAAATTTSGITVTSPSSSSTVGSPVTFSATASSGNSSTPITAMRLYVDSASVYTVNSASLTTSQPLATGTHNITFVAWDSTGKSYNSARSITVSGTATTQGTVTITSPTSASTVSSPAQFTATATPTTGTTISSMTLYVDGVSKYTANSASLSTSQTLADGSHTILVKAVDSSGASYQASESITVSTTSAVPHSVTVNWTENGSNVTGFNVYRKATGATSYTKLNSSVTTATGYTDNNVTAGAAYQYVVTAVSSSGMESGYSDPASATIPTP